MEEHHDSLTQEMFMKEFWRGGLRILSRKLGKISKWFQIMEKRWELAKDLYMVFINLEEAFDTVTRDHCLWEALRDPVYRVPPPLIRAIKSMCRHVQMQSCRREQRNGSRWLQKSKEE